MKITCILLVALSIPAVSRAAQIYTLGHADLGVGFEDGNLHLHFHAEDEIGLHGGGTLAAGEYEANEIWIGVPGPSISRPAGSQWNFLAPNSGDSIWFLPQSSDPNKPFLGIATEELDPAAGWDSALTWTLNSISTVFGENSSLAIWQNDLFGNPTIFASTLDPTADNNSWTQDALSHEHFNFGFTGEGIYDVSLTISGTNSALNETFIDTASFRFVTGSAITAIPEPGTMAFLGLGSAAMLFSCRKKRRADAQAADSGNLQATELMS